MTIITKTLEFDAGHRLVNHEGKCARLHGHRYKAEISVVSIEDKLDKVGRVIDFGKIKELVGGWIDQHWDHNMILNQEDPILLAMQQMHAMGQPFLATVFNGVQPFIMDMNPTAENMAEFLCERAADLLAPHHIEVSKVRLWETPTCHAEYYPKWHKAVKHG